MSARIPTSALNEEQKKQIFLQLTFRPKTEFVPQGVPTSGKDPIFFYSATSSSVALPYKYAEQFVGKPNANKVFTPSSFTFTGSLRDNQHSIVEEAIEQLNQHGTTLLNLYTGCGKTVVASYLAAKSRMITAVLMNSTTLISQWKATFETMTNAKIWIVGEPMPSFVPDVLLVMSGRCGKIPEELRSMVGLVVIDEAHTFCTPGSVEPMLTFEPRFVILCSATPMKANGLHTMLHALVGTHQVYRPLEKKFSVTCFRTGICPELKQNKMGTLDWANVVKDLCSDPVRNGFILQWVVGNPQCKILVLTWNADHAFDIHKMLTDNGIKAAVMARSLKKYSDSQVLVGTISKIGTGFDESAACADFGGERINLLLLVGSTKNEQLLTQLAGRVFRSEMPHIVDFVDEVPCIKGAHWRTRRNWYESKNATIDTICAPGVKAPRERRSKQTTSGSTIADSTEQSRTSALLESVRRKYSSK